MGKSKETYNKKEKEKKRLKKRKDKEAKREERKAKREERKANPTKSGLDDMVSYVDEYGNHTDTPPDPTKRIVKIEDIELGVPKREKEEEGDTVYKGRVEFFNDEKGFGFIKENDTNEKFFVHVSSLTEELVEGDIVSFEVERGLKGLNAVRVNKI